jgi:hypothetical protein
MEDFKKSTREIRKNKLKDKRNKFYGSQKHIRIITEKKSITKNKK